MSTLPIYPHHRFQRKGPWKTMEPQVQGQQILRKEKMLAVFARAPFGTL